MAISSLRVNAALRPATVTLKAARDVVDVPTWSALPWLLPPPLPVTLSIFARRNKAASFTYKENKYIYGTIYKAHGPGCTLRSHQCQYRRNHARPFSQDD